MVCGQMRTISYIRRNEFSPRQNIHWNIPHSYYFQSCGLRTMPFRLMRNMNSSTVLHILMCDNAYGGVVYTSLVTRQFVCWIKFSDGSFKRKTVIYVMSSLNGMNGMNTMVSKFTKTTRLKFHFQPNVKIDSMFINYGHFINKLT